MPKWEFPNAERVFFPAAKGWACHLQFHASNPATKEITVGKRVYCFFLKIVLGDGVFYPHKYFSQTYTVQRLTTFWTKRVKPTLY